MEYDDENGTSQERVFNDHVEAALMDADQHIPNFKYTIGDGDSWFIMRFEIPDEARHEETPELSNRFQTEFMAVGDVFELHGLPRPESGKWSSEDVDSDGEEFTSEFRLDDVVSDEDVNRINMTPMPTPNTVQAGVNNRLAGDDTPDGGGPMVDSDDMLQFAADSPTGDKATEDLMMAASGDYSGDRMESVRDAVGDYKEGRSDDREAVRESRRSEDRGNAYASSIAPRPPVRHGRGGQEFRR